MTHVLDSIMEAFVMPRPLLCKVKDARKRLEGLNRVRGTPKEQIETHLARLWEKGVYCPNEASWRISCSRGKNDAERDRLCNVTWGAL